MAEAQVNGIARVECGFCLRIDGNMQLPKILPCTHAHCLGCLQAALDGGRPPVCPICSEGFEAILPKCGQGEDEITCCDVCAKQGKIVTAESYCTSCKKRNCVEHHKIHKDYHVDHKVITIDEYKLKRKGFETRMCEKHKDLPYTTGCIQCRSVYCTLCVHELDVCSNGKAHQLLLLKELANKLNYTVSSCLSLVEDKEKEYIELVKQAENVCTEQQVETDKMIRTLRRIRDDQVEVITEQYNQLETELKNRRGKAQSEISVFKKEEAGMKLFELNSSKVKIQSAILNGHHVDNILEHDKMMSKIERLKGSILPYGSIESAVKLSVTGVHRKIDLKLVPASNIVLGHKKPVSGDVIISSAPTTDSTVDDVTAVKGLSDVTQTSTPQQMPKEPTQNAQKKLSTYDTRQESTQRYMSYTNRCTPYHNPLHYSSPEKSAFSDPKRIPKRITLLKTIELSQRCSSVCQHNGVTYMGRQDGTISIADTEFNLTEGFIRLNGGVISVRVHKDMMYALADGKPNTMNVYNLHGHLINSWTHTAGGNFAVFSDRFVIPDKLNKRITVYSLEGEVKKHIPMPLIGRQHDVAVCRSDTNCVIISHNFSSTIRKVNINTGREKWISTEVNDPHGVACYGEKCVCVYNRESGTICILDINTGKTLSYLKDDDIRNCEFIQDLHFTEDVLIVPVFFRPQVLFYRLIEGTRLD